MAEEKLFFTIGEVAQLIEVKPYVLRYWESEFDQLNPQKSETGQRVYRAKDVQISKLIKQLLYVEKYTIAGAKQKLKDMEKSGFDQPLAEALSPPKLEPKAPVIETKSDLDLSSPVPPQRTVKTIDRETGYEFKALLEDIRKILQKYNLA
jgi:DNA-binding transcriptional MerR regulator